MEKSIYKIISEHEDLIRAHCDTYHPIHKNIYYENDSLIKLARLRKVVPYIAELMIELSIFKDTPQPEFIITQDSYCSFRLPGRIPVFHVSDCKFIAYLRLIASPSNISDLWNGFLQKRVPVMSMVSTIHFLQKEAI